MFGRHHRYQVLACVVEDDDPDGTFLLGHSDLLIEGADAALNERDISGHRFPVRHRPASQDGFMLALANATMRYLP